MPLHLRTIPFFRITTFIYESIKCVNVISYSLLGSTENWKMKINTS